MQLSDGDLLGFARAATEVAGRIDPTTGLTAKTIARGFHSEGGRNVLLSVTTKSGARRVLKVGAHRGQDLARERWAYRFVRGPLVPRVHASFSTVQLVHAAARLQMWDALRALDAPLGACVWLERLEGQHGPDGFSDEQVRDAGKTIATLHHVKAPSGPRLACGSEPGAILRIVEENVVELRGRRILDVRTGRALERSLRVVQRQLDIAWRRNTFSRVRTLCHGDLRWHNMLVDGRDIRLVDFEHAGIGDPAVDIALMACRTPLTAHQEMCLIDGYLEARTDRDFIARYFTVKPALGLLGATDAVLDLWRVTAGEQPIGRDVEAHIAARLPHVVAELGDAIMRCIEPGAKVSPSLNLKRKKRSPPRRVFRGIIAVDGTAASGKSVLAERLAVELGVPWYNTGSAYRAVALHAATHRLDPADPNDVARVLTWIPKSGMRLLPTGAVFVDGVERRAALDVDEVETGVARWAAMPEVRARLQARMRAVLTARAAVIEGRDVGTILCVKARTKFYVDASVAVRAQRAADRSDGMIELQESKRRIVTRDRLDSSRECAPLRRAADAQFIDTTDIDIDEAVERALRVLVRR